MRKIRRQGPIILMLTAGLLLAVSPGLALAEEEEDSHRLYARLGLAIGWPNIDDPALSGSTGAGLSFVGGYHLMKGLAAEAELVFTAGTRAEDAAGTEYGTSASNVAVTVNAKAYPLDFLDKKIASLRPYAVFGLGAGSIGAGGTFPTVETTGAFLVRFGAGADWMMNSNWGVYADGSYYVTSEDRQTGYGTITFGALYAF